jgi:alkaline phosphatase
MRLAFTVFFLLCQGFSEAQPFRYSVADVHAHNDYDHNRPFTDAYALQLGSIEADVLWIRDTLFVAHSARELRKEVRFDNAYLQPLAAAVRRNHGYPYADTTRWLQLLIDIKTDSVATLAAVIRYMQSFPEIVTAKHIRFVISGNQPSPSTFETYPPFILFDGKLNNPEHLKRIHRIGLFSDSFANYSKWKGEGRIEYTDKAVIEEQVRKAHALQRPIRFWATPDGKEAWSAFMQLGIDYLNTDHISALAAYLQQQ